MRYEVRSTSERGVVAPMFLPAVLYSCSQKSGFQQEVVAMAKYLIQANYSAEGLKGLLKEGGSGRREAVDKLLASVGGKVESFYYAFGDTDAFVVVDVPDNVTAAGVALTVGASGAVAIKTAVLMTPEEVDQATKKSPAYRAPGA
jgi:uncharacterized protein with GYD domain